MPVDVQKSAYRKPVEAMVMTALLEGLNGFQQKWHIGFLNQHEDWAHN